MITSPENDRWVHTTFDKNTPPNDFGKFHEFKTLWDNKRQGNNLPAWRDFELEDFAPWWDSIIVEDLVSADPFDVRFRLWGNNVTTLYDADLTGQLMSEVGGNLFIQSDFDTGVKMVKNQLIGISKGPMRWMNRDYKLYSFIELPLSNDRVDIHNFLLLVIEHSDSETP